MVFVFIVDDISFRALQRRWMTWVFDFNCLKRLTRWRIPVRHRNSKLHDRRQHRRRSILRKEKSTTLDPRRSRMILSQILKARHRLRPTSEQLSEFCKVIMLEIYSSVLTSTGKYFKQDSARRLKASLLDWLAVHMRLRWSNFDDWVTERWNAQAAVCDTNNST